jgi:tetratricopeptide (TPR) repeat protein
MYELTAGIHPFPAEHQLAIIYSIINEMPPSLLELNPEITEQLESIIMKGLEKDPDNRYVDLKQMMQDLERIVGSEERGGKREERKKESNFKIKLKFIKQLWVIIPLFILLILFVFSPFHSQVDPEDHALSDSFVEDAMTDLKKGNFEQAITKLDQAVTADPSNSVAWSTLAAVSIRQNKLDLAMQQSTKAIDLDKNNADAYYNLAYALEENSQYEESLQNYQRAIMIDSAFTRAYSALGNLLIEMERPDEAITVLKLAEQHTPQSEYMFLINKNMGKAYYYLQKYDGAISHLQISIKTQSVEIPETWYYLGLAYKETGKTEESKKALQHYVGVADDLQKRTAAQAVIDAN